MCTDIKCSNSPLLCSLCFRDQLNRTYHFDHEKSILPIDEAVYHLSNEIRNFAAPLQKIFKITLGRN